MITKRDDILSTIKAYMSQINQLISYLQTDLASGGEAVVVAVTRVRSRRGITRVRVTVTLTPDHHHHHHHHHHHFFLSASLARLFHVILFVRCPRSL